MTELTLHQLINYVKSELMNPISGADYPIFFVDKVELELNVSFNYDVNAGISISVLNFAGFETSGGKTSEKGHVIKLTLVPILSLEEQRTLINKDERLLIGIEKATQRSLRKDTLLSGDME